MFDQLLCFSELSLHHAGLQQKHKVKLHTDWSSKGFLLMLMCSSEWRHILCRHCNPSSDYITFFNRNKWKSTTLNATLEACRRTSTTTLTGSPGVISFIASIHHLYAWDTRKHVQTKRWVTYFSTPPPPLHGKRHSLHMFPSQRVKRYIPHHSGFWRRARHKARHTAQPYWPDGHVWLVCPCKTERAWRSPPPDGTYSYHCGHEAACVNKSIKLSNNLRCVQPMFLLTLLDLMQL